MNLLSQNALTGLEGLEAATRLRALYAHANRIEELGDGLFACTCLSELTLHENRISDLGRALDSLRHLEHLHTLTLHGNPAENEADYRARVVAALPGLALFDNRPVTAAERTAALARFDESSGQKPLGALAFGTRGRNGATIRLGRRGGGSGAAFSSSAGSAASAAAPVAERVHAEAERVRRRQLTRALADTYASFTAAGGDADLSAFGTTAPWGGSGETGLVVSALINITDPAAAEGPVAGAVRAGMAGRGVPAGVLRQSAGDAGAVRDLATVSASAPVGIHLRQSLVPLPLPSYASQRIAGAAAAPPTGSAPQTLPFERSSPAKAELQLGVSRGGRGGGTLVDLPPALAGDGAPYRRLTPAEVNHLVMKRTGVRVDAPRLKFGASGRGSAADSADWGGGGGPGVLPDGRLGEWDKLRLLRLLRSAAGPSPGACVTGAQLRAAISAMADYGCVAIAPVGAAAGAAAVLPGGDDLLEAFLSRQCRVMDPRGTDRFGPREFVDAQDTGVYQVWGGGRTDASGRWVENALTRSRSPRFPARHLYLLHISHRSTPLPALLRTWLLLLLHRGLRALLGARRPLRRRLPPPAVGALRHARVGCPSRPRLRGLVAPCRMGRVRLHLRRRCQTPQECPCSHPSLSSRCDSGPLQQQRRLRAPIGTFSRRPSYLCDCRCVPVAKGGGVAGRGSGAHG